MNFKNTHIHVSMCNPKNDFPEKSLKKEHNYTVAPPTCSDQLQTLHITLSCM